MPIEVTCLRCTRKIRAPDKLAGKKVKCPDCGDVVGVPQEAPAPARQPPASKPAASKPARASQPAARPVPPVKASPANSAKPPRSPPRPAPQPSPPPPGLQVGDLLEEITSLEQARQQAEQEADYDRQQREASLNAYLAPMHEARAKQRQSLHGRHVESRIVDLGDVISRGSKLFASEMLMVMLVTWCAAIAAIIGSSIIYAVSLLAGYLAGEGWNQMTKDNLTAVLIFVGVTLVGFVLYVPYNLWIRAGLLRYYLRVARGDQADFLDLLRGGRHVPSLFGGAFLYGLFGLILQLPGLTLEILSFFVTLRVYMLWIAIVIWLVLLCCVFIFLLKGFFYDFVIVDKSAGPAEAIGISNQLTTGNVLSVLMLLFLLFALMLVTLAPTGVALLLFRASPLVTLGLAVSFVLLLFVFPYSMLLLATAYVDMTGQTPVRHRGN